MKHNFFSPKPKASNRGLQEKQPRPLILAFLLTGAIATQAYPGSLNILLSSDFKSDLKSDFKLDLKSNVKSEVIPLTPMIAGITQVDQLFSERAQKSPSKEGVLFTLIQYSAQTSQLFHNSVHNSYLPAQVGQTRRQTSGQYFAQASSQLPAPVAEAVLEDVVRRSGLAATDLNIVEAKPQMWPNGCLGLAEPDVLCTMAIVPGWQVTVIGGNKRWIYRTNQRGSVVKLDEPASKLNANPINFEERDPEEFLSYF
ncbi:MAG: hypothetical protein ACRC8A_01380 [Microcoleaceae cyanobacterium]